MSSMDLECDCLNWCGDDPAVDKNKVKPCKHLMLARLRNNKAGTANERLIVAKIGKDVIKLGHVLNQCRKKGNVTTATIIFTKYSYARSMFQTAKSMLTIKSKSSLAGE